MPAHKRFSIQANPPTVSPESPFFWAEKYFLLRNKKRVKSPKRCLQKPQNCLRRLKKERAEKIFEAHASHPRELQKSGRVQGPQKRQSCRGKAAPPAAPSVSVPQCKADGCTDWSICYLGRGTARGTLLLALFSPGNKHFDLEGINDVF